MRKFDLYKPKGFPKGFPVAALRLAAEHANLAIEMGDTGLAAVFYAISRAMFNGFLSAGECEAAVTRMRELMAQAKHPKAPPA